MEETVKKYFWPLQVFLWFFVLYVVMGLFLFFFIFFDKGHFFSFENFSLVWESYILSQNSPNQNLIIETAKEVPFNFFYKGILTTFPDRYFCIWILVSLITLGVLFTKKTASWTKKLVILLLLVQWCFLVFYGPMISDGFWPIGYIFTCLIHNHCSI